jgi:hypothetical protein
VVENEDWPEQTLTQLEGEDWGEPVWQSWVVTNSHHLRHKPLREFTAEDLRFMLGQQISLPVLMPMALDVLETAPFAGDNPGSLLHSALAVDTRFWRDHPDLWRRLRVVVVELDSLREFIERELGAAAERFKAARPEGAPSTESGAAPDQSRTPPIESQSG